MQALVSLYCKRGYPVQVVQSWLKKHYKERWEKRLNLSNQEAKSLDDKAQVLVLKTKFNTAWNYFSASEFGDTILGYWREWLERADRRDFNTKFPPPSEEDFEFSGLCTPGVVRPVIHMQYPVSTGKYIADVGKLSISKAKVITSRKRTRNLLDLTNLWKKVVLATLDESAADEPAAAISGVVFNEPEVVGFREEDIDENTGVRILHQRRSSSPTPTQWRLAHW